MKSGHALLFVLVLFVACGKEEKPSPSPPPDFYTAIADSNYFKTGCTTVFCNDVRVEHDSARNVFMIEGYMESGPKDLFITLSDSTTDNFHSGTFELSGRTIDSIAHYGNVAGYKDYRMGVNIYNFYTYSFHRGTITVHFDEVNKMVTGTLSFHARYSGPGGKEITITSGKFSKSYK